MSPRVIQRCLALIFLLLGGWCLLFPGVVEELSLRPDYRHNDATTNLLLGCFGAQAMLCGTVIWFAEFRAVTFLVFGIVGSVPFFVFNWYFLFQREMFTLWMLLDFAGNLGILACGIAGWRLMRREQAG
ncbi:hypothetical protein B5C34_15135 [Pacificimonas flava]|uniref:Uncharacterized protein n=2 Tax=Pacificimonas TaxID=1960290 RepID=A0A219B0I5_9SPHN|nr:MULTISPECIES: hypothetical protein [Pacificimonas]MBZ6379702.1 hypothetical protein [Pacificimonas aurantium]OWV31837.1 hypothetical protein B5C34_15135 [Pacificimonas flava]